MLIDAWGGDRAIQGTVRRIEPVGFTKVSALGIEEQRVNVIVDLMDTPESWERLGHGFRVETEIILWESADVLRIPLSAIFRHDGRWSVFVEEDGKARRRAVELGRRNDQMAQVTSGLAAGETIVLYPGDRVDEGVLIVSR